VYVLGVACAATAAFACVSAIGSARAESGDWRWEGLGINFEFESATAVHVEGGGISGVGEM
jgi:hypothetical protein